MTAADDIGGIAILGGVAIVGYYLITSTNTSQGIPKYNPPVSTRPGSPTRRGVMTTLPVYRGGGTTARGGMLYRGTGRIITGDKWTNQSQQCWSLASGGCRSSSRFQCEKGCCVPYRDLEANWYFHAGPTSRYLKGTTRAMLSVGGPGQSGKNCCVYSLGFIQNSGQSYAEEEGPHSPSPTIYAMPVQGDTVGNIGPIVNRTIGIKSVLWHDSGGTQVEGWVDSAGNGSFRRFYKSTNPHGGSLPVITHSPMAGDNCQEARGRIDGVWPVNWDTARTFVAELAMPISRA